MSQFQRNVKASFCGAAVLCGLVLSPTFAQTVSPELSGPPITSVAEANRLIGGPTLITLHFKNVPLRTVVEELAKQAGIKLRSIPDEFWQQERRTVTVDIDRQPYWLAVRAISKASNLNLSISRWNRQPIWNLTQSDELNGPYVSQGPFLIVANGIRREYSTSASIRFGSKPEREERRTAQISVSAFADPKLQLIGNSSSIDVEQVIDEKGNSFKPNNPSRPSYNLRPSSNQTFFASLNMPSNYGKRIAKFKGYLRFLQSKKSVVWVVPNIMSVKDVEKIVTVDGVTSRYVVNDVKKTGDEYQVRVTVFYSQPQTPDSPTRKNRYPFEFQSDATQFMRLLDAKGQQFGSTGYGSRGGGNQTSVSVSFVKSNADGKNTFGEPVKLVMEFPTEFTEIKVPFVFTDLPLP